MDWKTIAYSLLTLLLPVGIVYFFVEWAKFYAWVQSLPKLLVELIGVVAAFGVGKLAVLLGITLPGDLGQWTQATFTGVLLALARLLLGIPTAVVKLTLLIKGPEAAARMAARRGLKLAA